ncbi:MAG: hypothetical protein IJ618_06515 [Prevotella sp.]|nr:hypothetical protein [Prevotella sp.]
MMLRLAIPLLATVVIELAVLLFLRERRRKVLLGSVCLNVLTNVPLNFYYGYVCSDWATVVVGEILVVLVEALGYWWLIRNVQQALVYCILCNAISFLIGELFFMIYLICEL